MDGGAAWTSAPTSFFYPSEARYLGSVVFVSILDPAGLGVRHWGTRAWRLSFSHGDQEISSAGMRSRGGDLSNAGEVVLEGQLEVVLGLFENPQPRRGGRAQSRRTLPSLELPMARTLRGHLVALPWSPLPEGFLAEIGSRFCLWT